MKICEVCGEVILVDEEVCQNCGEEVAIIDTYEDELPQEERSRYGN